MKQIFINLPVQDLEKAVEFYSEIGFTLNSTFSDEQQKCIVWSEQIYVMLHSHKQFSHYSKRNISNTNSIGYGLVKTSRQLQNVLNPKYK